MKRSEARRSKAHLSRLKDMPDFGVAEGAPDVRGWPVVGASGEAFARVEDLIVDRDALKVRYLAVCLEPKYGDGAATRYRLLPIGIATLDEEAGRVRVPMTAGLFVASPAYGGEEVEREHEEAVRRALAPDIDLETSEGFYKHPHYDENRFYRGRPRRPDTPRSDRVSWTPEGHPVVVRKVIKD